MQGPAKLSESLALLTPQTPRLVTHVIYLPPSLKAFEVIFGRTPKRRIVLTLVLSTLRHTLTLARHAEVDYVGECGRIAGLELGSRIPANRKVEWSADISDMSPMSPAQKAASI